MTVIDAPNLTLPFTDAPRLRPRTAAKLAAMRYDGLTWPEYVEIVDAWEQAGRRVRTSYDAGRLEITLPTKLHDFAKITLGDLLRLWAYEARVRVAGYGSTTCREEAKDKGLEPDACFYVQGQRVRVEATSIDLTRDPPPDLAIEVDVTASSVPRQPIYAGLGVSELWRWADGRLRPFKLDAGRYVATPRSSLLPDVPLDLFEQWVNAAIAADDQEVAFDSFRAWADQRRK